MSRTLIVAVLIGALFGVAVTLAVERKPWLREEISAVATPAPAFLSPHAEVSPAIGAADLFQHPRKFDGRWVTVRTCLMYNAGKTAFNCAVLSVDDFYGKQLGTITVDFPNQQRPAAKYVRTMCQGLEVQEERCRAQITGRVVVAADIDEAVFLRDVSIKLPDYVKITEDAAGDVSFDVK